MQRQHLYHIEYKPYCEEHMIASDQTIEEISRKFELSKYLKNLTFWDPSVGEWTNGFKSGDFRKLTFLNYFLYFLILNDLIKKLKLNLYIICIPVFMLCHDPGSKFIRNWIRIRTKF